MEVEARAVPPEPELCYLDTQTQWTGLLKAKRSLSLKKLQTWGDPHPDLPS